MFRQKQNCRSDSILISVDKKVCIVYKRAFGNTGSLFYVPGNLVPITKKRSVGMHDIRFAHRNDLWYNKDCALIKAWIPDDDGLQDCDMDLWDIYADYINGKREIAEINALMTGTFYTEKDLND